YKLEFLPRINPRSVRVKRARTSDPASINCSDIVPAACLDCKSARCPSKHILVKEVCVLFLETGFSGGSVNRKGEPTDLRIGRTRCRITDSKCGPAARSTRRLEIEIKSRNSGRQIGHSMPDLIARHKGG